MNEENIEEKVAAEVLEKKKSGTLFGVICILITLLIAGYFIWNNLDKKTVQGGKVSTTESQSVSTSTNFTPEFEAAIDKFISTRIAMLSPVPAATGTTFVIRALDHTAPGERLIVYSDATATYTAKGVFSSPEPKKINIVSFDLVPTLSSSSSLQHWDNEGLQLAADYIKAHVSELSPEKEVLGGKFYITNIVFENAGNAVVEYEDGHIALRAHVSFMVDGGKNVEVLKWEMLSNK